MSVTLLKSDSYTVFSSEYCENFKNSYFEEHPRTSASVHNFLINALRASLIRFSLENTLSMANLPVSLSLNFFCVPHLSIFFVLDNIAPMK